MSDTPPSTTELKCIVEALLLAAGEPLSVARIASVFDEQQMPPLAEISRALEALQADLEHRGIELVEVSSGFRLQTRSELIPWVQRLWEEKPQRYSRALLETLALIAYRQPITRGEIEEVRGVSLSSNIIRTLQEREWVRVVGHRDVPGKPALFGTTRAFLDYFQLKSLDDLPTLAEIRDMENLEPEFDFDGAAPESRSSDTGEAGGERGDEAEEEAEAEIAVAPEPDDEPADVAGPDEDPVSAN